MIDALGHSLDGVLGNAAEANAQALNQVETNAQSLGQAGATVLNDLATGGPAQALAGVLSALHGQGDGHISNPSDGAGNPVTTISQAGTDASHATGAPPGNTDTTPVPNPDVALVDHLSDTVGHAVGGPAGAVLDALGHSLDGVLGNWAEVNAPALSQVETNAQSLGQAASTVLNDLATGHSAQALAGVLSALGDVGPHATPTEPTAASQLSTGIDQAIHVPSPVAIPLGAGAGGGSFWDQVVDAVHHATGGAGSAYTPSTQTYGLSPNPVSAYQTQPGDTHSTGAPGEPTGLGDHQLDGTHTTGTATADQGDHAAYPQFELPTLHPSELSMHH